MYIKAKKQLFWFLKDGVNLDLSNPGVLDMYIQQVITRGNTEDVRMLLSKLDLVVISQSIERIKRFIPKEVSSFWEDFVASNK